MSGGRKREAVRQRSGIRELRERIGTGEEERGQKEGGRRAIGQNGEEDERD